MSIVKDLIPYTKEKVDFDRLIDVLQKSFEISYGNTYSIKEAHEYLLKGFPVIAKLKNKIAMIVGENPGSLIMKAEGELVEISDKDLREFWTGNVIIVTDRKANTLMKGCGSSWKKDDDKKYMKGDPADKDFTLLYEPDLDSWEIEQDGIKNTAKAGFTKLAILPEWALPDHPIIVVFRKPTAQEKKEKARAWSKGVYVHIIDDSDPLTELLHEIGHIFWYGRVKKDEKNAVKKLFNKLNKKDLPSIFTDRWEHRDEEELFCTLYIWWAKGLINSPGYHKILESQYQPGWELMNKIFRRVSESAKVVNFWERQEPRINSILNSMMHKSKPVKVNGKILRIKNKVKIPTLPVRFPVKTVDCDKLGERDDREWYLVKAGELKDKIIILRNGFIDFQYMKSYGTDKVPKEIEVHPVNRKPYKKVIMVKAENAEPIKVEKERSWFGKIKVGSKISRRIKGK